MIKIKLSGPPEALITWAKQLLEEHGYKVVTSHDWETPTEICKRLKISAQTFCRRMKASSMPEAEIHRGPGGRVLQLASNETFDAFLAGRFPGGYVAAKEKS